MRKFLMTVTLGALAAVFAVMPALAQEQSLDKLTGNYEFDAPDFGLISILIEKTEAGSLTISAMDAPPSEMAHISGMRYEFDSPEFGVIAIGFIEDENGDVTMMTIDGYDFSFVAEKREG